MILSRVWYVLLGAAVAVTLYVVYVAVGQYNRQTTLSLKAGLASDSQTGREKRRKENREKKKKKKR